MTRAPTLGCIVCGGRLYDETCQTCGRTRQEALDDCERAEALAAHVARDERPVSVEPDPKWNRAGFDGDRPDPRDV